MGSQLTKNYDVEREARSEGGITGAWKIYSATRRDASRSPVSIFTFDKRLLDRKANKQEILNRLKLEISNLIRLRHPNLLQILEPMLEDKTTIACVTEPLEYCLGDLLRRPHLLSNCLGDTETRLGILDVIQGLSFLHNEARLVHMSLCPDNIYISLGGKWKIGGLAFASSYTQDSPGKLENVDIIATAKSFRYQVDIERLAPLLHFVSPEVVSKALATPSSDVFSLGCTIFAIYKALSNTSSDLLLLEVEDFSPAGHLTASRNAARPGNPAFTCLPDSLPDLVVKMIAVSPSDRSGLHELSVSKSLQTPYVKTIYYLEHLQEKQDAQKMQFFKGLTSIIAKFDKVIMFKRLLPALVNNMQHANLTPFVLPSLLTILKTCEVSHDMFQTQIWPSISKLALGKEIPAQSFFLILSEIDLLVKYTETEACRKTLMPLVYKGYECGVAQIQTAIMDKTPALIKELADVNFVRVNLLPKFLQGIINSKIVPVKESGLKALACIFSQFDRATMVEIIIPSMEKFKKFDITGPMVMHLLTIYEGISKVLGHKATSVNILPALLPLLVEAELSKTEFEKLFASMISMMHLIKDARAGELTDVKDEIEVSNVRNEEVEEVNDIFRDIFDQSHPAENTKTETSMPETRTENRNDGVFTGSSGIERNDFRTDPSFGKVENVGIKGETVKSNMKDFQEFNPMKDFSFNSVTGKNDFKPSALKEFSAKIEPVKNEFKGPASKELPAKFDSGKNEFKGPGLKEFPVNAEPVKNEFKGPGFKEFPVKIEANKNDFSRNESMVNPFNLEFGKTETFRPEVNRNDPFFNAGSWKNTSDVKVPASVDPFQFNPSKNERFTGNLDFLDNQSNPRPTAKPVPIIGDIFADFQNRKEENKGPKFNIAMNPASRVEDPKPGSLKPPAKKVNNAETINNDDFFNQLLNNSNKKDPFAGL